jgi:hypothetical protein
MTSGFRTVRPSQCLCGGGEGGERMLGGGIRQRRRQRWWKHLTKYGRGPVGMYVWYTYTLSVQ